MKGKRILAAALALLMLMPLYSCAKEDPEPSGSRQSSSLPSLPTQDETSIYGINLLTGMQTLSPRAAGMRPVAVMINNMADALPQNGVGAADILFEIPVEGGITRMMGIYGDMYEIPDICSVRSCRYYFPIFAIGFDAIYVHWGSEKNYALNTLYSLGVDRVAAEAYVGNVFDRDEKRLESYAAEHCSRAHGANLPIAFQDLGLRIRHKEEFSDTVFRFNAPESPQALSDGRCAEVILKFSDSYFSTFNYNEQKKVYTKLHSGNPHIDGETGEQLAFTNLLALETNISVLDSKSGIMRVDWSGGTGYCFSGGSYIEITWSKQSESSPIEIFDGAGKPVTLNAGKTYIGIIGYGKTSLT